MARLLPELTVGISRGMEQFRAALLVGAAALAIIALARPQWGFTLEEAHQKGLDIVVAIDTSKSMLADDIKPNRLARAKLAALDLMQTAKSDRLGLVAFAGTAFLQCPMTIDEAAFRQSVDMLDVNTLPQGGTAIAEAIDTALAAFKEGDSYKVLVLFTDGEDHDSNAVDAARKAAEQGLRIFTIGIGSPEGEILPGSIRDADGNVVKSRLNESLLKGVAEAGHGFYLPMRGAGVIETLYEKGLAPLPKSESETKLYKRYHEQYHWPLALAILLLMTEILLPARGPGRSTAKTTETNGSATWSVAGLFALLLLPSLASASPSSALRDYQAGRYDKAENEFQRLLEKRADDPRLALNAGAAAYRNGKFDEAEKLFGQAAHAPDLNLQQRAYYNRGNALFRKGATEQQPQARQEQWEKSLSDFQSAMKLNAQDADAKNNYEFVKKKLEELKQQQQQQKQNKDQQQNQKQDQQNQQNQKDQQQKQDQQKSDEQKQQEQQKNQQNSDQQKQSDEQKKQQEQEQARQKQEEEQKKQQQQAEQSKPDDKKPSENEQQQAVAAQRPGEMSPEQARRMLDTMKGDEQVLPLQQLEAPPATGRPVKDW